MKLEQSLEELNAKDVWHELYFIDGSCPNCDIPSILDLTVTLKSIKIVCGTCGKAFFYRRIEHI